MFKKKIPKTDPVSEEQVEQFMSFENQINAKNVFLKW